MRLGVEYTSLFIIPREKQTASCVAYKYLRDLPIIGNLPGTDANVELNTTINRPKKDSLWGYSDQLLATRLYIAKHWLKQHICYFIEAALYFLYICILHYWNQMNLFHCTKLLKQDKFWAQKSYANNWNMPPRNSIIFLWILMSFILMQQMVFAVE